MKALKHSIDIQPFDVPNFVRQVMPPQSGSFPRKDLPAIPLVDLSVETLDALCSEFRRAVFEKAGKEV